MTESLIKYRKKKKFNINAQKKKKIDLENKACRKKEFSLGDLIDYIEGLLFTSSKMEHQPWLTKIAC